MKCINWFLFLLIVNSLSVFSQEKYAKHTVAKGETISGIAKKYNVDSSGIYELNPDVRNGIKYKTVLLIPVKAKKTVSSAKIINNFSEKSHEVLANETLYGIAKHYNISIDDLYKSNSNLENEGLKNGQLIKIPQALLQNIVVINESKKVIKDRKPNIFKENIPKEETVVGTKADGEVTIPIQGIEHEVLPKESYYSIAKKYQIAIADLQKANSNLGTQSLKVGQKIIVPVKSDVNSNVAVEKIAIKEMQQVKVTSQEVVAEKQLESEINHEVLPKETSYGIAKQYGITVAELEEHNPNIAKKLLVGSVLNIRSSKIIDTKVSEAVNPVLVKEESNKKDLESNKKKLYDASFVDQLIAKASENIGTRYRTGGTTQAGFDCSGLICYTFANSDIKLPRTSIEMANYGLKIDAENAQKCDLIFFKTRGSKRINHVGMVVEVLDGDIKFIHSSSSGGVIISSIKESYYKTKVAQVNRVL